MHSEPWQAQQSCAMAAVGLKVGLPLQEEHKHIALGYFQSSCLYRIRLQWCITDDTLPGLKAYSMEEKDVIRHSFLLTRSLVKY